MPGFKKGEVPSPNYERDDVNQFSQVSEFTNDVYVYGTLYADIEGSDINFDELVEFNEIFVNDLTVGNNLQVSGFSTFVNAVDMDYLTVYQRHNVGAGGTVFVAISTTSESDGQVGGRVGIGSTQPDNKFQVGVGDSSFNITNDGFVGLGVTQPVDMLHVGVGTLPFVVSGVGSVGIGTTRVAGDWTNGNSEYDDSIQGPVRLDVDGSIHIAKNIYDSAGSPGGNGFFLNRDEGGIRWVSFEPSFTEGIFIQDEGNYIPSVGAAQSFTVLNYRELNSYGLGADSVIPIPSPSNPTQIADIQVQDYWGHVNIGGTVFDVYRMSKVGIMNNSPGYTLDVTGDARVTDNVQFDSDLNVDGVVTFNQTLDVDGDTTLNSTLDVDGDTTLNSTLDVDGIATFNDATEATSTTTGSVQIDGGVGIVKKLFVGGQTKIESVDESTSKDTGSLVVEGGVGIEKKLNVGGDTKIEGTTESQDKDSGALVVEGGVGIEKKLNVGSDTIITGRLDVDDVTESTSTTTGAAVVDGGLGLAGNLHSGGSGTFAGRLDVDDLTESSSITSGAAVIDGGVGIGKNLNVGGDAKITGDLELDKRIIDFFGNNGVGICKTDYRLSSFDMSGVGMGVSWRPSGVQTKRTIWVTKNGCDTNSGLLEGDAKYTIGAAAAIAQEGDTIRVRSGTYLENNPVGLRDDVAINGEDLRLVLLIPENKNRDFFHVRRGCLIENLSFTGTQISDDHSNCGAVAFPPTAADVAAGLAFQAATGYTALGPANEGSSGRWRSPYVRNCTNFMSKSIGMKINGDHAISNFTGTVNLGQELKSMVCDSFTQYNEAGIGVSLSNNAYAQLVSIFTICSDIGIAATSGGQCDLTNSNSSFGRIGLLADGFGDIEFDGTTLTSTIGGADSIISNTTQDQLNNNRTPFDGQGAYFHLDMSLYADSPSTATITKPMELVRGLRVINGGADGDYTAAAPPIISLVDSNGIPATPEGPESILPEFSPNVSAAGTITSIDVLNSGRNFLPGQDLQVAISGSGSAQLEVDMDPILFTVSEASETSDVVGLSTVVFNEFIPYPIASNVKVEFVRLSRIITSSHSFEYIGAGTDINTANPFQAGQPIPENEVVAINGGQVPFTSTDQKGNFRIGDGLTIDQTTSSIRGRDFNRAIQAQLTPLILALN